MSNYLDTLRATMTAFGYRTERIDAALSALTSDSCTEIQQEEAPYLSPRKLCKHLDISGTTLWRHNPPYHRIGGRKRYLLKEVMAHMGTASEARKSGARQREISEQPRRVGLGSHVVARINRTKAERVFAQEVEP